MVALRLSYEQMYEKIIAREGRICYLIGPSDPAESDGKLFGCPVQALISIEPAPRLW